MTGAAGSETPVPGNRIVPVILSGGAGTRLWPLSTPERPKQFLPLTEARTLLQLTVARVADPARFAPPIIVGSAAHAALLEQQVAETGIAAGSIILEPCPRNTAPAVALAALCAPPGALLLAMPSDHAIGRTDRFLAAVLAGAEAARRDRLVTFGVRPDRPETGYGYIRRGAALGDGALEVAQFVEKPDAATAASYLQSGDYEWNSGIFLFRAGAMLAALESHAPAVLAAAKAALGGAAVEGNRVKPDLVAFGAAPSLSIDHAVMEHTDRAAIVPVDMGWSDIGSWDALFDTAARDEAGNARQGSVTAVDARNCLLHSDGPQVIGLGIEDLIVVATGAVVLVMRRGESQRVKDLAALASPAP